MIAVLAVGGAAFAKWNDGTPEPSNPTDSGALTDPAATDSEPLRTYRAFSADSWWNSPVPWNAPTNPAASQILDYMRTAPESGGGCLTLAGAGDSPWGNPIYWAEPSDPTYDVKGVEGVRPPELSNLRIPVSAEPAANNDGTMSVYDRDKGYVALLTNASYDRGSDEWSATGATVTYLRSNGLSVDTGQSDDERNIGSHRGNNGATNTVSWDMVQAGAVRHVMKVALGPEVLNRAVFPMTGSDGDYEGTDAAVPPQGLRLRIKPSVDLESMDLNPQALVIASALQRYGFYIGDSGGTTALKLENTEAEGRGRLWKVTADNLCGLPFTPAYWDVLAEGYDPSQ
ncbi:MAG: hypothetical protein H0V07_09315 [Propionibacteriales bacterium]|nr:hypothetical protein [Propionibacteriales bacterium]